MNKDFCRALTLLRKEKGLSQKQAAADLSVSQALLSHYEKGIRECSLDFVIKAADYYEVSTDYLLGRTAEKNENFNGNDSGLHPIKSASVHTPSERLIVNTLRVIYSTLSKISNRKLTRNVSQALMLCEYKILRSMFYEHDSSLFTSQEVGTQEYASAAAIKLFSDIRSQCDRASAQYVPAVHENSVSEDSLVSDFGADASSMFHVISQAENILAKMR